MMEPDADLGLYGLWVYQEKEYIRRRQSRVPLPSKLDFTGADPHFLLVCLRGLGFVFRVASLRLAISNKEGLF